ncbi:metallophosphoesterase [Listeria ivanovii]|uniref:metallophosphoesterase n=1 Tax=Listeria ivanovii TaxID=1638 RepID=UPI00190E5621|nr:metallophosphoesterase [Listeria ivanovii]MBK3913444.1 metallophosphoesterase [Listeria ivanovii subsp. ivanovii]MBK3920438.1 metallophosphoesterase [Listeria ivanovii subsp. ivanovii]MBK3925734.1 metallophosphoesterase [Listeria ivanovii subsp. ivanovii]
MKKTGWGILGAVVAFTGYAYWSTKHLTLTNYEIVSDKIPKEWNEARFVQLSDLHSASFGLYNNPLLSMVNEIAPDAVFLTGDILDGDESPVVAMALVRKLAKKFPTFYVSGNHEGRSAFYEDFKADMEAHQVTVLENERYFLKKDGAAIMVAGVQDPRFFKEDWVESELSKSEWEEEALTASLDEATSNLSADYFTILLAHRPEFWSLYQAYPVDLVLSGHAHGGQFRLPLTEGLFAPGQGFLPKWTAGIHRAAGKALIVSRGLGNVTQIPRLFNDPEVIQITLKAKGES